jgi:hypothetical protein
MDSTLNVLSIPTIYHKMSPTPMAALSLLCQLARADKRGESDVLPISVQKQNGIYSGKQNFGKIFEFGL